jgi:hypothetical protein
MMKKLNYLTLGLLVLIASCASKRALSPEKTTIKNDKVAYITALSIKEKSKGFEVELQIGNLSADGIIFTKKTAMCGKGQMQGIITKFANESGTDTLWPISKGKNINLTVGCKIATKIIQGEYFFTIGKIHKNPKDDGMTVGDILISDMTLKIPENELTEKAPAPSTVEKAAEERVK